MYSTYNWKFKNCKHISLKRDLIICTTNTESELLSLKKKKKMVLSDKNCRVIVMKDCICSWPDRFAIKEHFALQSDTRNIKKGIKPLKSNTVCGAQNQIHKNSILKATESMPTVQKEKHGLQELNCCEAVHKC